jgi:autoinducer 2-degrading protein
MTDRFLRAIGANARASLRDEPGCLRFDVHRDLQDPDHYFLYEIYADERAFQEGHRNAPQFARWREEAAACLAPGSQVNTLGVPLFPNDLPEARVATAGI